MKPSPQARRSSRSILSGLRIRKKLIVLHTSFSLGLGSMLLVALSPAMSKIVDGAEQDQAALVLDSIREGNTPVEHTGSEATRITRGTAAQLGIDERTAGALENLDPPWLAERGDTFGAGVIGYDPISGSFVEVRAQSASAQKQVRMIYLLLIITLLAGYALVAIALEFFVLPQHVYSPISALLAADDAVTRKDEEHELVPEDQIPADELGEIMRSRNESVRQLRAHEAELSNALTRLEVVAVDLHKKNKLLEAARRNLEGADRLASLGMMSAGIAHELNTPLAVVKGLVEKLTEEGTLSQTETALLARVVGRIEKLSEGLLDFARARTPELRPTKIRCVVDDAWNLLKLDRQSHAKQGSIEFTNDIDESLEPDCDPDRMVQVFVNLIRNAIIAMQRTGSEPCVVRVESRIEARDGHDWAVVSVTDTGPGIDPSVIDTLFDPFVSGHLDSKGTGLGLAVTDGIVREHGGFLVPSNRPPEDGHSGARFDVFLPMGPGNASSAAAGS